MASTSAVKPLINRLLCVGHVNVLSLLRYDDRIFFSPDYSKITGLQLLLVNLTYCFRL